MSIPAITTNAPLRVVFIEKSKNVLFKGKSDQTRWLKTAILNTAYYWIKHYLPLRFNRQYATYVLGYRIGGKKPFHETGALKTLIESSTTANVVGGVNTTAYIHIPMTPGPFKNIKVKTGLKIVPHAEIQKLAKVFEAELQLGMQHIVTKTLGKRSITPGATVKTFTKKSVSDVMRDNINREKYYRIQKLRGTKGRF